jgi:hypothetical protein
MTDPSPSAAPLLPALRIGITGTRQIEQQHSERIVREVERFLSQVREDVSRISRLPPAQGPYGAGEGLAPILTAISPIAEGADRLFARAALDQGFSLICPLPFARDDYENDFVSPASKQEFRTLLQGAGANVVQIDGARGDAETRSYEAVGRYVVRNCDILVAIWNGKPGRGFGGTTDILRFAVNHGPPVWWIHAERDEPSGWLIDGEDFRKSADGSPRQGGNLRGYLEHLILPPTQHREKPVTAFERVADLLKAPERPPYLELSQPKRTSATWIWKAHGWLIGTMAGTVATPAWTAPAGPADPAAAYWFAQYRPADALAGAYARRYRSSYVWTFAFATMALIVAAIALVVPSEVPIKLAVTGAELICLAVIAAVVFANERHAWHRHFLEFRLFAELCRKQQALALCGWSLQGPPTTHKSIIFETDEGSKARLDAGDWVAWLFGVLQRAAPQVQGTFDPARAHVARNEILSHLIDEQLLYHRHRAAQSARANARLGQLAEWSFLAVLAIVVLKLVFIVLHADHDVILGLGLAAAILPALSAGFVGIRSYTELSPMADQSRRMEAEMTAAKSRIERIQIDQPLASQALGSEVFGVATAMLRDIEGWIQLFSSKIVEPG